MANKSVEFDLILNLNNLCCFAPGVNEILADGRISGQNRFGINNFSVSCSNFRVMNLCDIFRFSDPLYCGQR